MKKVYDWDIRVNVYVETCKKKYSMVCSVHTNLQEIALRTAKLLDMDCFDTKIEFYFRNHVPLRATSTLFQHEVKDNDILTARIVQTKKLPIFEEPQTKTSKNKSKIEQSKCYGLAFICTCVQPRCTSYGKDVQIPFGSGEFPFFQVINGIKCKVCPYRDQMKNPPMIVKEVQLSNCVWKVEGTHTFRGFPTHHVSEYKKCIGKHNFYDYLRKYKWQQDLLLTVKDL